MGATIMPHNIYLHSSLAQSRRYDHNNPAQVNEALRFANWDSNVHLVCSMRKQNLPIFRPDAF